MRAGRLSDRLIPLGLIVAGLVGCAALLVLAAQAHAAPKLDYGDAPDGAGAGYEIAVTGKFPSLAASKGPRHKSSGPSLGIRRDTETDSKQVDRDRFDDGVSLNRLGRCKTSEITVLIDTRGIPKRLLRKNRLYLNSWFDWDRSGVWGEANGCPNVNPLLNNEWAIVNQGISGKAFLKERVRAFSFRFRGGLHSEEFWARFTLTLGQKLPIDAAARSGGATGSPYAYGETEDYLIQHRFGPPPEFPDDSGKGKKEKKKKEKKEKEEKEKEEMEVGPFTISCLPNPATVEHGRSVKVKFFVKDEGKGPIYGKTLSKKSTPNYRTRILRHSNQRGVPNGYFRAAGFSFRSKKRDKRANPVEREVISFSFVRGKVRQVLKCAVTVIHEKIVKPKQPHKPAPVQPLPPGQAPSGQPATGGAQIPVHGQGFYQSTSNLQKFQMGAQFDQDVEGFRIHLKSGPSPEFADVENATPGLNCSVSPDHLSVLCTGNVKALQAAGAEVLVNPAPPSPGDLEAQLEVFAIEGGVEQGPFPVKLK
jgi:hypothetical protein